MIIIGKSLFHTFRFILTMILICIVSIESSFVLAEDINLDKEHYFDFRRKAEYVKQLEKRYRLNKDDLNLSLKLYKAYFLTENFSKSIKVIKGMKKYISKHSSGIPGLDLRIDLAHIQALAFSYQFGKARKLCNQLVTKYKNKNEDMVEQVNKLSKRFKKALRLPRKKTGDSAWSFNKKMTRLPVPYDKAVFSLDGNEIFIRRKNAWYGAQTNSANQRRKVRYLKFSNIGLDSKFQKEHPELIPAFGKNTFYYLDGNITRYMFVPFNKNLFSRNFLKNLKGEITGSMIDMAMPEMELDNLQCDMPAFDPEQNFLIVSCKENEAGAPGDLFLSYLVKKDKWSNLRKLSISSEGDDIKPFFSPDKKRLYFSSDGHIGYGGFDYFSVSLSYRERKGIPFKIPIIAGKVRNIGPAFNSFRDESQPFGFSRAAQKIILYRSTQKNGLGIYTAKLKKKFYFARTSAVKFHLRNQFTKRILKGNFSVIPKGNVDKTGKRSYIIGPTGKYVSILDREKYFIKATVPGYFYYFDALSKTDKKRANIDILLKPIKAGQTLTAKGILFDLNKATLKKEAREAINAILDLLVQNTWIRIRLEGHTAHMGQRQKEFFNKSRNLSKNRAQAVKRYLIKKGIDPRRIETKGFGPTRPIRGINRSDARNRRTEIRIIDTKWKKDL